MATIGEICQKKEQIAARLRAGRAIANLDKTRLGEITGLGRQAIAAIEREDRGVSLQEWIALSSALEPYTKNVVPDLFDLKNLANFLQS